MFKVKKAQSEIYLKNEQALDDYLMSEGVEHAKLTLHSGDQITGRDLLNMVQKACAFEGILNTMNTRGVDIFVLEQAAILGLLNGAKLNDHRYAEQDAHHLVGHINKVYGLTPKEAWTGAVTEKGDIVLSRKMKGVPEQIVLPAEYTHTIEARQLSEKAENLALYKGVATLDIKGKVNQIPGFTELFKCIQEEGRRGMSIQRYKGLGEMNGNQLWETTLDPEVRTLLQVQVSHVDEANDIFSVLMGESVESRRNFIQENSSKVRNLDA